MSKLKDQVSYLQAVAEICTEHEHLSPDAKSSLENFLSKKYPNFELDTTFSKENPNLSKQLSDEDLKAIMSQINELSVS